MQSSPNLYRVETTNSLPVLSTSYDHVESPGLGHLSHLWVLPDLGNGIRSSLIPPSRSPTPLLLPPAGLPPRYGAAETVRAEPTVPELTRPSSFPCQFGESICSPQVLRFSDSKLWVDQWDFCRSDPTARSVTLHQSQVLVCVHACHVKITGELITILGRLFSFFGSYW